MDSNDLNQFLQQQKSIMELEDDPRQDEDHLLQEKRRRKRLRVEQSNGAELSSGDGALPPRGKRLRAAEIHSGFSRDTQSNTAMTDEIKSRDNSTDKRGKACGEIDRTTHFGASSTRNEAASFRNPSNGVNKSSAFTTSANAGLAQERLFDPIRSLHTKDPPIEALLKGEIESVARSPLSSPSVTGVHLEDKPAAQKHRVIRSGQTVETSVSSKHQRATPRNKVLRRDLDSADTSNVTTPSRTPAATLPLVPTSDGKPTNEEKKAKREQRRLDDEAKRKEEKARKLEKEAERRMTQTEYAIKLQQKPALQNEEPQILSGKRILYVGGDFSVATETTRKRMDVIWKRGGTVVPSYDPSLVTHIVTDAKEKSTLQALKLQKLEDIPEHIPTVTWGWVASGRKGSLDFEFLHPAFASRIDADPSKAPSIDGKGKGKAVETPAHDEGGSAHEEGISTIEEYTMNASAIEDISIVEEVKGIVLVPSSSLSSGDAPRGTEQLANDPLAEYYEQAKKDQELEAQWLHYDSSDEGATDVNSTKGTPQLAKKRGFTCDQKPSKSGPVCANQDIIDKLTELKDIHSDKPSEGDHWRAFSLTKTLAAIRRYPERIRSYEQALSIPFVGDRTARKIMEIVETGKLDRIKFEKTEDVQATRIFKGIYGVGPQIAYKWYQSGCRTLEDVINRKGGITLSEVQEIGVRYYDDINTRIPRGEVQEIFDRIKAIALEIDPVLFIEVMGSFRRGKADCGDIDILITRPDTDKKTHAGVLRRLLEELHARGILTEDLALPDSFDSLEATYRGLCRRDSESRHRRIDVLTVPYCCRGAALLYYTGDDIFNRAIRYKAGRMGYSLNQRGLYKSVVRDPHDRQKKTSPGVIVASETEEQIFKILGVPWQEPHERVRAVT